MRRGFVLLGFFVLVFTYSQTLTAGGTDSLSITGVVRQPLNLTIDDLEAHQSVMVQLNEVMKDGEFRGVFNYRGVPLRTLLELASVRKQETGFSKPVDLAILVCNRQGKKVALSWGEVFYRNPGEIIVATKSFPIMPHKDCKSCHRPDFYKPFIEPLKRSIGFPKLVIAGERFADRCLEEITSIELIDLYPEGKAKKTEELFAPEFTFTNGSGKEMVVKDLSRYNRIDITVNVVGEGKGYHGARKFSGVRFKDILEDAGIAMENDNVFLFSAPDGYRSLLSYGEVFLDTRGERVMISDTAEPPSNKGGKFTLVIPDDLMADRFLSAVEKIEVISLRQDPKIYVIGVGCGDTDLITLEAVSNMAKADVVVCPEDIRARFSKYMGDSTVLFDLYAFAPPRLKRKNPGLSEAELKELRNRECVWSAETIKAELKKGRTVAILEYGDPTLWSGWRWVRNYFKKEQIEIVPGISSFNASNAMIHSDIACNGSVIITTPWGLKKNESMLKSVAEKGETICVFMGLRDLKELVQLFLKYYPDETEAALVYKAGYSGSERMVMTNIRNLVETASGEREKFLGLIYIGPCLSILNKDCH